MFILYNPVLGIMVLHVTVFEVYLIMTELYAKICRTQFFIVEKNEISLYKAAAGRSSRGRAFAHGAMGRRIDPSWDGPIELFLVPASAPRLV